MASFTITVDEGVPGEQNDRSLVTFAHVTPQDYLTVDDTSEIFEKIREAVTYLGIEP